MADINFAQVAVTALLSGGFISGVFSVITKSMSSPETKNELAKQGNQFARELLEDARIERQELRQTVAALEQTAAAREETIERLKEIVRKKELMIVELESRHVMMARKIELGEPITLQDVFGAGAPLDLITDFDEPV